MTAATPFKSTPTSELPPLVSSPPVEYKVPGVHLMACLVLLAHLGPFFGIFFSSLAGDNDIAWWSLCFIGTAVTQYFVYLSTNTAILVRHESSFEFQNYYGKTIGEPGPLALYEAVEALNPECTKFAIVRTDEHMHKMKESHPWCACMIGKKMTFCFTNNEQFAKDHGFADKKDQESA